MDNETKQPSHREMAENALDSIGGVRENGSLELAPIAQAHASLAIAEQLERLNDKLDPTASTQPTSAPPVEDQGPIPSHWSGEDEGEHWAVLIEHDRVTEGEPCVVAVEIENWDADEPHVTTLACASPEQAREMAAALTLYAAEVDRENAAPAPPQDASKGEG